MILIIGGAFQGKERAAEKIAAAAAAGGKNIGPVLAAFHRSVRDYMETRPQAGEEEIRAYAAGVVRDHPSAVITMDEVGCGVVPVDGKERAYREAAGWAGQELAAMADEVYRVTAGILTRIK